MESLVNTLTDENKNNLTTIITMKIKKSSMSVDKIGKALDRFLSPRPWWYITKEPFKWDKDYNNSDTYEVILQRFPYKWEMIFIKMLESQYPINCNDKMLRVEAGGFDSFGNYFGNYENAKNTYPLAITVPYITGPDISFLDDNACPHIKNKFLCAFLPITNCTLPGNLNSGEDLGNYWTSANKEGKSINEHEFNNIYQKVYNKVYGKNLDVESTLMKNMNSKYITKLL